MRCEVIVSVLAKVHKDLVTDDVRRYSASAVSSPFLFHEMPELPAREQN
jgi:hypothetical protein